MNESSCRSADLSRATRETNILVSLTLDGSGRAEIATGLGFLDHMLTSLACHASFDLKLQCTGDLGVDDHHTVEDCAISLGQAIDRALADRVGIARFGCAYAPMDESLARAVVDLVVRPHAEVALELRRPSIGPLACENLTHFFRTLATSARFTLHVDVLRGGNDHHKAEAAFKATALALRQAVTRTALGAVPSTKGVM